MIPQFGNHLADFGIRMDHGIWRQLQEQLIGLTRDALISDWLQTRKRGREVVQLIAW